MLQPDAGCALQLESEAAAADAGGQAAADLREDFTKEGNLLDGDAAIQGVPALRVARVDIKLGAAPANGANGATAADRRPIEPTAEQLAYRDDTGVTHCLHRLGARCTSPARSQQQKHWCLSRRPLLRGEALLGQVEGDKDADEQGVL